MAIRDYECSNCGYHEEFSEPVSQDPKTKKCPKCGKKKLRIVILSAPRGVVKEIKTVGQQAEKNWKEMGSYKQSEIAEKEDFKGREKKVERAKRRSKIANATQEQKRKYIEKGII
jgi:putative FmdB family regulatory protein